MALRVRAADLGLALGATTLPATEVLVHGQVPAGWALLAALAALTVAGASLLARDRAPFVVLAVTLAGAYCAWMLGHRGPLIVTAPMVALYAVGQTGGRWRPLLLAGGAATAGLFGTVLTNGRPDLGRAAIAHAVLAAGPVLLGATVRLQRADAALARERSALAAREQEDAQRRRIEQERRRIARDLHDVVAHALTTINVQAAVAAHLLDRQPQFAREALGTINGASRTALHELRGIVGLLRDPDRADAPVEPGPGIERIGELVAGVRVQGLPVTLSIEGCPVAAVPESVQVAAFRIVQESLTNVRRHAAGAATTVRLQVTGEAVSVLVRNAPAGGRGRPAVSGNAPAGGGVIQPPGGVLAGGGAGVLGMRERALLLGGELEAAPCPDGGFQVRAELPYREVG